MTWRLGLDLGTNSIGWAALELNAKGAVTRLLDMGVCIFPDGREPQQQGRVGDSLAVTRRLARSMRRNRDRGKNRKARLMAALVAAGLMPGEAAARKALEALNPYELRARAVGEPLSAPELGRALFHLGLRRGFKSNRKTDGGEESGKQAERIAHLREALSGHTLGQYLWAKLGRGEPLRFREGAELFPERAMYEVEFDAIRAQQKPHHPATPAQWEEIRECVFFQHPLRPVERGRCEFFPDQDRAHKDLPIAQTFRILQELNNLRWIDAERREHPLDPEQRDHILAKLHAQQSYKFTAMRKAKGTGGAPLFPDAIAFNLEDERRKDLSGHKTDIDMAKPQYLGDLWATMPEKAQNDLFELLHEAEDDADIIDEAAAFGLTPEQAARVAAYPLTSQTAKVSRKFMERICPVLYDTGLVYAEAVAQLTDDEGKPLHHSHRPPGELLESLPYYGAVLRGATMGEDPEADPEGAPEKRFGRIANPTVHVALNQLRRLVNALIEGLGPPAEIHVEVGRELKQSREDRDATTKRIGANQRENDRIAKFCAEHGVARASARDIRKVKLWEELGKEQLDRRCIYSGRIISAAMLFNGEAEIEHILPFSRTLDNGQSNMTLSLRWANQLKGNATPFEAFGDDRRADKKIVWRDVLARVEALPKHKRWRFGPGAMEKFETDGGFIQRQLTDNAYIARTARGYLGAVCPGIVVTPGMLTGMLRGKWGWNGLLSDHNKKTREDHRHHAVDALVVALTTRSLLQRINTLRGRDGRVHIEAPAPEIEAETVATALARITVAFKPDHGLAGRMFHEWSYSLVAQRDPDLPEHNLVTRKPLNKLSKKQVSTIRDVHWRRKILEFIGAPENQGRKLPEVLSNFSNLFGIQRARFLVKQSGYHPAPADDPQPQKVRLVDSYAYCDVWEVPVGKPGKWKKDARKWVGCFRSYVDTANPPSDANAWKPHPAARKVARLFKNDLIEIIKDGRPEVVRVIGLERTSNRIALRPVRLAVQSKADFNSRFEPLRKMRMRKLHVTPDGRIAPRGRRDP